MHRLEQKRIETQKQSVLKGEMDLTKRSNHWEKWYRPLVTALVGAFVGFLVGLTSVGSGTLIIVSMAFLFPRLTAKELVGTDIFQAFMLLAAGAIPYLSAGTINWPIVGMLLIGSVAACLRDGLGVRGYTYWSALDNFEWSLGYRPTSGLIAVDRRTQERTVKPSARWLGRIARAHGF